VLSSTNLVIEIGIKIAVFLNWQFVVGEYIGGILFIAFMWVIVSFSQQWAHVEQAFFTMYLMRGKMAKSNRSLQWLSTIQFLKHLNFNSLVLLFSSNLKYDNGL
jgi:hypothetical protein